MSHYLYLTQLIANEIQGSNIDFRNLYRKIIEVGGIDMQSLTEEDIDNYMHGKPCKNIAVLQWGINEISSFWIAQERYRSGYFIQNPQDIIVCSLSLLILVKLINDDLANWELRFEVIWENCLLIYRFVTLATAAQLYTFIFKSKKFNEFIREIGE